MAAAQGAAGYGTCFCGCGHGLRLLLLQQWGCAALVEAGPTLVPLGQCGLRGWVRAAEAMGAGGHPLRERSGVARVMVAGSACHPGCGGCRGTAGGEAGAAALGEFPKQTRRGFFFFLNKFLLFKPASPNKHLASHTGQLSNHNGDSMG